MAGIRVVKAFVKEEKFASDFSPREWTNTRDASMSLVKIFGFFFPLISFLSGLTTLILLAVGGNAVIQNRMSAGEIVGHARLSSDACLAHDRRGLYGQHPAARRGEHEARQ